MVEISVKDATHDDAQYPSRREIEYFGIDFFTSEKHQRTFMSAIVASAFSMGATGKLDYAWKALAKRTRNSKFFAARKK